MRLPLLLMSGLLLCSSCGEQPRSDTALRLRALQHRPVVLTTFYPTTYFAQRIAGQHADVRCPLPAAADPVSWKPSQDVLAAYQSADLIVTNGARLEKWVGQVSLPSARVLKTAARFHEQWVRIVLTTHSHGPEGEHSHYGVDGHTWLDPRFAILQSRAIADALIELRPDHAADFEAGFASLEKDLMELHAAFEALADQPAGESL